MVSELWQSLGLTLQLATITTLLLLLFGLTLAHLLNSAPSRFGAILEAIVGLPIVLPPTVLGFYLLVVSHRRISSGQPGNTYSDSSWHSPFPG
jgi:molybdate transport system permease protein